MGFAASQARFLSLTSRLSDIEYEAQQISQERLALNNQMELYADEYENATTNETLVARVYDLQGSVSEVTLDYNVIIGDPLDGGLGMNLVTSNGQIVVPDEAEMQRQIEKSGNQLKIEDFYIFEQVKQTDVLQKNILDGNFYFAASRDDKTGEWDKKTVGHIDTVRRTWDRADDAAAKAKYDKRMNTAEKKDAMFEMRLEQLDTQHKAIETEMESVQKLVDDSVENTFKTFG